MKTRSFLSKIVVFFVILLSCPLFTLAQGVIFVNIPNPAQTTQENLSDVWGSDANNVFAVGVNGKFIKYDGSSATEIPNSITTTLTSVSGFSANDVWAVGGSGTAAHYNGSSITSYNVGASNSLRDVEVFASDNVWTCGINGTIAHWNG